MKRYSLLLTLLLLCMATARADNFMQLRDKSFNFGAKVGFNASFPIVGSLSIEGIEATDIRLHYRVGYTGSIFCRINVERFFIQPSFAWNHSNGELFFTIPGNTGGGSSEEEVLLPKNHLSTTSQSLELPVLIGYNLVKQAPYGLSFMAGPKLKYNYKVSYKTEVENSSNEYISNSTPLGINLAAGISVTIGRLFLDFVYEFGLSEVESDLEDKHPTTPASTTANIRFDKRTNLMSFSLGFLF